MPRRPADPSLPKAEPWKPSHYEVADVAAIQALQRGDATEDQQKRALRYVIEVLCGTYDLQFRPGGPEGDRNTCFAAGKAFVGQQMVKMLHLNTHALKSEPSIGKPPT